MSSEKKSKLANLFSSSGRTTPQSKRGSPNSSHEEEDEDEHEHLLCKSPRTLTRSKASKNNEADYKALKEAALYNAKLMSSKKIPAEEEKKKKKKRQSGAITTKKELLEMEVSLLSRLSEQNDTIVAQKRQIILLEARLESQELRLVQLETSSSSTKTGGCGGDDWFSSLFQ